MLRQAVDGSGHIKKTGKKNAETNGNVNVDADNKKDEDPTFIVSNEVLKNLKIKGFFNYENPETDVDGLHFGKVFYNRRLSPNIRLC